jgi:hypothetical protein
MTIAYFEKFPLIGYNLNADQKEKTVNVVSNIFTRVTLYYDNQRIDFRDFLRRNTHIFYKYQIKDGDRPEIIAHKLYGSADLYWFITLFNNILDPVLDWPKDYISFQRFIKSKYGSIELAKTTVHHYEKIITTTTTYGESSQTVLPSDATEYATLVNMVPVEATLTGGPVVTQTTTRNVVYNYEYEETRNEEKRTIYLLKKDYTGQIIRELEELLENT